MEYHQVIAALVDETSRVCEVVVASDKREFKDKRREQGKACHVLTAELLRVSSFLRSLATKDLGKHTSPYFVRHLTSSE